LRLVPTTTVAWIIGKLLCPFVYHRRVKFLLPLVFPSSEFLEFQEPIRYFLIDVEHTVDHEGQANRGGQPDLASKFFNITVIFGYLVVSESLIDLKCLKWCPAQINHFNRKGLGDLEEMPPIIIALKIPMNSFVPLGVGPAVIHGKAVLLAMIPNLIHDFQ